MTDHRVRDALVMAKSATEEGCGFYAKIAGNGPSIGKVITDSLPYADPEELKQLGEFARQLAGNIKNDARLRQYAIQFVEDRFGKQETPGNG